jgi:hypothetical protein
MESGDQVENLDSAAGPSKNNRRAGNQPSEPALLLLSSCFTVHYFDFVALVVCL